MESDKRQDQNQNEMHSNTSAATGESEDASMDEAADESAKACANAHANKKTRELTVFIISDSVGDTASALVNAAMSQFAGIKVTIERLPKVSSAQQVADFVQPRVGDISFEDSATGKIAVITIADPKLSRDVCASVTQLGVACVDLLSPTMSAIAKATGMTPALRAGINRTLDESYFKRIEAMDYSVDHDDGRLPEEYKDADIILMGVSRTSKTPLSMYLATYGYKVANLPLAPGMTPPKQIYEVDRWRIFGLMSSPTVLSDIRQRRLGPDGMRIAKNYASVDYIEYDLDEARAFMRKIGCIVIRTDNRAIEETAQEILRYYEMALQAIALQNEES